jgi:ketosteroid isomerase-like protein
MKKSIAAAALGLLAAGLAGNANAASVDDDLRALVERYWTAWQKGPDAAAPLYAKDADLVFYDLEPLKYVGWNDYKRGVVPNILDKFDSIAFKVGDDVKTNVRRDIAWTTATVKGDGMLKGGAPVHVVIRHTAIWEKRGANWLIVHEHVSVPSSLPAPKAKPAAKSK